ncbi:MAG TPA: GNAT family N-acetyltransferase [Microbacterium sp.]|nr:GNAT family N-acetyltransferase [Microbacterium sp.]
MDDVTVRPIRPEDAGEVLTLQRAAFVQEALIYRTIDMPPLTQTLEELEAELRENLGIVAVAGTRIIGAVRAQRDGELLLIGRLAIAPDQQGRGVGTLLLEAVEERGSAAGATVAELFTGSLSDANLRLYERVGYVQSQRVKGDDGIEQIFLRKRLTKTPSSQHESRNATG